MQKIRITGFFFEKIGYIGGLKSKRISTNGCFGLHIYLRTNKTLIHNFLHVFENLAENYSKNMFVGGAKLIRIIGDPD
jgi:hypothetical protein